MEITEILTTDLAQMSAGYNPRKISDHDLKALGRSLRAFDVVEPIVVNRRSGRIVGGQLNIALNKISGEFDQDKLTAVLQELETSGADLALTGFTSEELELLIHGNDVPEGGETDPDAIPDVGDEPETEAGDLIVMGKHRLLCGDSTDPNTVPVLFGKDLAACMWTDPPYGVDYKGVSRPRDAIDNDVSDGLQPFLSSAFTVASIALIDGAAIYVAHPDKKQIEFITEFVNRGWKFRQTLVWIKDSLVMGHSDYQYRHESILFGYTAGEGRFGRSGRHWYGDNTQTTAFEIPRPKKSLEHPTMKPVELIVRCLSNSTKRGDIVYEPFMGSGSTLIACESIGRKCYGLEIDARYCDVIVKRWQKFTGNTAEGWRGNGN